MASFTQTWSAGFDATVMQTSYGSITTAPGGSATYPSVIAASEADLDAGALVHWTGGSGDWSNVEWVDDPYQASPLTATVGACEVVCREALAQAFTDCVEMDFRVLQPISGGNNHPDRSALSMYLLQDTGSTWIAALGYYVSAAAGATEQRADTYTFDTSDVIGSELRLKVCWDVAGQSLKMYFNGTLIYNLSSVALTLARDGSANQHITGVMLGEGVPGPIARASLNNTGCVASSQANLLTGSNHTVSGSNDFITGVSGTVTGDRNALFALCEDAPSISGSGIFKVCADIIDLEASTITLPANFAQLFRATVTLTDAQVKNLPTTAPVLVAAPGSGLTLVPHLVLLFAKFAAGAYTNVDAALSLFVNLGSETWSSYIANDAGSTPALTYGTTFCSAANKRWVLREWVDGTDPAAGWGSLSTPLQFQTNGALTLVGANGGSGNFTGGNAANSLTAITYYSIETVP